MNFTYFVAQKTANQSSRVLSRLIVRIAIGGIALSLTVMLLSLAIIRGFKREIKQKARSFSGDIQILKYTSGASFEESTFAFDDTFKSRLKAMPNVVALRGQSIMAALIKANDEVEGVVFKGYSKDSELDPIKCLLLQGRFANPNKMNEVVVSNSIARKLKLKIGDKFLIYFIQNPPKKRKLKIVGIVDFGFDPTSASILIGNLSQLNSIANVPENNISSSEISLQNFELLDNTTAQLHEMLPIDLRAYSTKEWFPDIFEWLSLLDMNTALVIVLMLAVAIINMISALLILILEKTQFIGLMKALGASNWWIQKVFLYQIARIMIFGLLIGNTLGLGLGLLQHFTHFLPLDADAYYMAFIPIQFNILDIAILNLGTFGVCITTMLLPSMLISRIHPVKTLTFK